MFYSIFDADGSLLINLGSINLIFVAETLDLFVSLITGIPPIISEASLLLMLFYEDTLFGDYYSSII